ncbi:hypothetical protein [Ramlibacter pallidus]|uniref:Uncharacterized protein n=1 Tax=Ramlibacter pallidus TaxID=2780087 RepID=A0ABR9S081_9BURK|nr:hypothetical protein [Ramlibacter pallidus]MBE7366924.1 hypothetical protein [Ramlibacter pallidus]
MAPHAQRLPPLDLADLEARIIQREMRLAALRSWQASEGTAEPVKLTLAASIRYYEQALAVLHERRHAAFRKLERD